MTKAFFARSRRMISHMTESRDGEKSNSPYLGYDSLDDFHQDTCTKMKATLALCIRLLMQARAPTSDKATPGEAGQPSVTHLVDLGVQDEELRDKSLEFDTAIASGRKVIIATEWIFHHDIWLSVSDISDG